MSDVTISVNGLAELQKFLDQLPAKIERNIMRGALRAGAKVIEKEAKTNIHSISGELRDSLKIRTGSRRGTVTATIRSRLFYARFVEYGTRPHRITSETALAFGKTLTRSVDHPGAQPHPFMRPALDSRAQDAIVAAAEYIKKRLTKEGLNASGVEISAEGES